MPHSSKACSAKWSLKEKHWALLVCWAKRVNLHNELAELKKSWFASLFVSVRPDSALLKLLGHEWSTLGASISSPSSTWSASPPRTRSSTFGGKSKRAKYVQFRWLRYSVELCPVQFLQLLALGSVWFWAKPEPEDIKRLGGYWGLNWSNRPSLGSMGSLD